MFGVWKPTINPATIPAFRVKPALRDDGVAGTVTVRRFFREPLLHFFVLGAVLFALFGMLNRDALRAPEEIVVDDQRIAALRAQFERTWQRPPTPDELSGLVDNWVREEMLYREGVALGLETDDPVIRRRLVQKVSFMTEALVDEAVTDEELQRWLREHPDDYRIEPRISLRQVYFDPERHDHTLGPTIDAARKLLDKDPAASAGDPTLLPARIDNRSSTDVTRSFGSEFGSAVFALPVGQWSGPVTSAFGVHLVRVDEVWPPREPLLDEVRDALVRDLIAERRQRAAEALLTALRKRYTVVMPDATDGGTTSAGGAP